jgi:hypothetical protein
VVATFLVGFQFLGWTLASTAAKTAQEQSRAAVVAALAPACALKFHQAEAGALNLVQLGKESPWMRGTFIQKGGWAEFPGQTGSISDVAEACAKILETGKT